MLTDEQQERVEIVAVSVDDDEKIQMMIDRVLEEDSIVPDYTFLTDSAHLVIDRYGLFNPDEPRHRPVPHPTTLVIDLDGVIRWRFTEVNYRVRPTNDDILAAVPMLARGSGVFAEPAGAAAYAGLIAAVEQGLVTAMDEVVVLSTGNGLKDIAGAMKAVAAVGTKPMYVDPNLEALKEALSK